MLLEVVLNPEHTGDPFDSSYERFLLVWKNIPTQLNPTRVGGHSHSVRVANHVAHLGTNALDEHVVRRSYRPHVSPKLRH